MKIGVIGSGAMGSGIAQVAAQAGHEVVVYDQQKVALDRAKQGLIGTMSKLVEKGKLAHEQADEIVNRISFQEHLESLSNSELVIEAIVENLEVKKQFSSRWKPW